MGALRSRRTSSAWKGPTSPLASEDTDVAVAKSTAAMIRFRARRSQHRTCRSARSYSDRPQALSRPYRRFAIARGDKLW